MVIGNKNSPYPLNYCTTSHKLLRLHFKWVTQKKQRRAHTRFLLTHHMLSVQFWKYSELIAATLMSSDGWWRVIYLDAAWMHRNKLQGPLRLNKQQSWHGMFPAASFKQKNAWFTKLIIFV